MALRRLPFVTLLCGWFLLAPFSLRADEAGWRIGFAKARITPEPGLWLAGYAARDHAATGTLQDLWIKALALEDAEGDRAVLVTADLLGFPQAMYEAIGRRTQQRCGLERADIMLCASHTHSGPVLRNALFDIYPLDQEQRRRIDAYSRRLEETVVETIAAALKGLHPARLSVGVSSASFAANRREGRYAIPPTGASSKPSREAPVDHTVPVMAVHDRQGELEVAVFGYACHCTTLDIDQWNGDYAGFAQAALEDRCAGSEAMFVAGCGADQNPAPRRSVELCRAHGEELARAVAQALEGPMRPVDPQLATGLERIDLPFGEQPDEADLTARAEGTNYQARWAARLLEQLRSGRSFADGYAGYPVQVWRLGRYRLVALGGEVVVDYMLALRARLGPDCWVAAYANDVMAYIPSRRVWEEGGYEAGAFSVYGLPAVRWSGDIEERILEAAVALADRLSEPAAVGASSPSE